MQQSELLERCRQIAGSTDPGPWQPEDAIGMLQGLRPGGERLPELFAGVPHGEELLRRLRAVYAAAGDPRRATGGMDAYFIVRQPEAVSADGVERAARQWLVNLAELDRRIGPGQLSAMGIDQTEIRVLEGLAPKHPRDAAERSELLTALQQFPDAALERLAPGQDAALALRRAYYFIACDAYLRDFLLWPVFRAEVGMDDPLDPYFTLWRHGIKYRAFGNDTVDFYIPRR